jgi:hypothetical protein
MSDTFQNTPNEQPAPTSADTRQAHADERNAGPQFQPNDRYDRSSRADAPPPDASDHAPYGLNEDGSGQAAPSGKTIRESLREAFAQARASEGEGVPEGALRPEQQPVEQRREADQRQRARQAHGRFESNDARVMRGEAPPGGWSAEAKSAWAQLPQSVRQAIGKREIEVSDGFRQNGEERRAMGAWSPSYSARGNRARPADVSDRINSRVGP